MRLTAVANPYGCGSPRLAKTRQGQQHGRDVPNRRGARPIGNGLIDGRGVTGSRVGTTARVTGLHRVGCKLIMMKLLSARLRVC